VPSKQSHHVFIINGKNTFGETVSVSSTCNSVSGEATSATETTSSQTFSNIKYSGCTFIGQAATVAMNGCTYTVSAAGEITINCTGTNKIEIIIPGCTATIEGQPPLKGITYRYYRGR
jgi:hypothetical protein